MAHFGPEFIGAGVVRRQFECRGAYTYVTTSQVGSVPVEISVLLGRSVLPMQQLLRMGRGAVIPLDAREHDEVWILANNHPVARGEIQIFEEKISIIVTRPANVYDFMAIGS